VEESKRKPLFSLLLLLLVAAVLVGFWYYWEQLLATAPALLVFVPDCPLYVLLAIPIALGAVRSTAYSFLVALGMFKYGLWTVFVLLFHWNAYSAFNSLPITLIFIIGHIGMALLGAALLPKKKIAATAMLLILAWLLLNDISDYAWGTVPPIPKAGLELVAALTFLASIVFTVLFFVQPEKVRNFPPVAFFREIIGN
jgi:uncharacterized membrane protein YpjA